MLWGFCQTLRTYAMKRLVRRINFRLSFQEEARYAPLIRELHLWNWSELCRLALRRFATDQEKAASDKVVIQPIALSDTPAAGSKKAKKKSPPAPKKRPKAARKTAT